MQNKLANGKKGKELQQRLLDAGSCYKQGGIVYLSEAIALLLGMLHKALMKDHA